MRDRRKSVTQFFFSAGVHVINRCYLSGSGGEEGRREECSRSSEKKKRNMVM